MKTNEITNHEDVIDSRDVIERIEELTSQKEDWDDTEPWEESDEGIELAALENLAEQAEGASDWQYGETLIRDTYFEDYARELADDIGAIDSNATWPTNCIDWEEAADQLQQDYSSVDFDGITYWIRL